MRPVPIPHGARRELAGFATCLAALLEVETADVPVPTDGAHWARWGELLAARGLGFVRHDAERFSWPGYWIALLESAPEDLDAVVLFDGAVVFDPREGERRRGSIREAVLLAAYDPLRPSGRQAMGVVEAIFLAAETSELPRAVTSARALAGRGLEGDRYAEGRGTFAGGLARTGQALTLIEAEALEEIGLISPAESRRNVVARGVDLNGLVGREFTVGDVRCLGRRLCEPCAHLEGLTRPGVLWPLVHRAGLRADVLTDGMIAVGDTVAATDQGHAAE